MSFEEFFSFFSSFCPKEEKKSCFSIDGAQCPGLAGTGHTHAKVKEQPEKGAKWSYISQAKSFLFRILSVNPRLIFWGRLFAGI